MDPSIHSGSFILSFINAISIMMMEEQIMREKCS